MVEGYSLRQLADQSGHSSKTLQRITHYWLAHPPVFTDDLSSCRYLVLDGTFMERPKGLFAAMNAEDHTIIHGMVDVTEGPRDLSRFCRALARRGAQPTAATIDGNPHLIRTLRRFWPEIIIQRCLVHIQRQGLSWCRRNPKSAAARHLRQLFLRVCTIHTRSQRDQFLHDVQQWENRFGCQIAARPERGRVFSDLKRARSMLLVALPDMFHYLQDPRIVTSTNGLEGYFGRLKQRYRQHRGLAKHQHQSYFLWYFHLCPR
jgi:hypothetical protein